jgi:hypothetical protein
MISSKRISLALAALVLVVLAGASSAFAQVTYQVTTTPTFVINTGRAESLGSVRITATSPTGTLTVASTTEYLFKNIGCDNNTATGVSLLTDPLGVFTGVAAISQIVNTPAGCVVSVTIPGGLAVTQGVSFIEVQGARGRVDLSLAAVPGANIIASLSATPSSSSLFTVPNEGVVGISAIGLTFVSVTAGSALQCIAATNPTLRFREGFNGAFVQHVISTAGTPVPANARPVFGGTRNTQVRVRLNGLPAGATVTWPATVAAVSATSQVELISQTTTGDTATYEFTTPFQNISDTTLEQFNVTPTVTLSATPSFGVATVDIRLYPDIVTGDATVVTSAINITTIRPRFNDPFIPSPAITFITVGPCRTNLLYPWTLNFAGFDTGIAIANTSTDPYGTVPQSGTCTVNLFPTDTTTTNGVSSGPVISITTNTVQSGGTWRATLSGIPTFAGKAGYIIAVCNFQYGHGFAFFTDNFGVGAAATAQGYVANIIPDPAVIPGRVARPDGTVPNIGTGEGLGN